MVAAFPPITGFVYVAAPILDTEPVSPKAHSNIDERRTMAGGDFSRVTSKSIFGQLVEEFAVDTLTGLGG